MLHQLMDPRGEYLEKLNASIKTVYVTQLSEVLIMQLNIFKYSVGISKQVVLNLSINKEILLRGNRMVLSGLKMRENSLIANITHQELIKVDNTWFLERKLCMIRKEGKKAMHDNLDDKQKEHLKIECNKRKKKKQHENLNVDEKEEIQEKRKKKVMRDELDYLLK